MSKFLVTGGAGFIGSEIVEKLVGQSHEVVVVDDLSTGKMSNLNLVINNPLFTFVNGNIEDFELMKKVSSGVDYIIHQAALVSVPKSIIEPINNHNRNINGFLNILECMRINKIKRLVYATSSAVYGTDDAFIKTEDVIGKTISPYALAKYIDELYADLYERIYGVKTVGLRYFNVYGPKQDPSSAYSGVISIFFDRLLKGKDITIYGDGQVTRDFINVKDVAKANIMAATLDSVKTGEVYNIGTGVKTSILDLAKIIVKVTNSNNKILFDKARDGDILYSCANTKKAKDTFGFNYEVELEKGLSEIYNYLNTK